MKKKIVHVVGNRPQFIKLAAVSQALREESVEELVIHTGQHYDFNMSNIFFNELEIPYPYKNLNIGSGTHAEMTANAMCQLEKILENLRPDIVLVYGDTDSTLAAVLAVSKLKISIAHIEAGVRTYNKKNPEECNRIVADHLSDLLFCSDRPALDNLRKEGCTNNAFFTGDVMYDIYKKHTKPANKGESERYVLMTWHRQENTDSCSRMNNILNMIELIPSKVLFPIHPRTKAKLIEYGLMNKAISIPNLQIISPVGYMEMIEFMSNCQWVLTDSGGVSKESSFAGVKCLFMLDLDIWRDLLECGWITKVNPDNSEDVIKKIKLSQSFRQVNADSRPHFYGDGDASYKIVRILKEKGYI